jgi:hypothetical protein
MRNLQHDPDIIDPGEVAMTPPQRKSTLQHLYDSCLGKPFVSAQFLHSDTFDPAPRPSSGPPANLPPSSGIRSKLATDSVFREHHPELMVWVHREDRNDFFDRLRARLGKPVTAAEAPKPKQKAQPHTSDGDTSNAGYFERLRGMLGGK